MSYESDRHSRYRGEGCQRTDQCLSGSILLGPTGKELADKESAELDTQRTDQNDCGDSQKVKLEAKKLAKSEQI